MSRCGPLVHIQLTVPEISFQVKHHSLRAENCRVARPTPCLASTRPLRCSFSAAGPPPHPPRCPHAHDLFDELLHQDTPVPARALSGFLAALARAPASTACSDGLSLAFALFNRMPRGDGAPVPPPTVHTYGILLDCCYRARQPDLALTIFGRFLRAGLKANIVIVGILLKVLCRAKRTDEAADVLLHRMPHLGCVPDAISYNTVIKGLCDDSRSQHALELLRMMAKQEASCSPDVVSYTTVIHGFLKEGKFSAASNLFHEMVQQGVVPNVVTYSSMIDALCKRGRSREARQILDCAILKGLKPDIVAYSTMLHGYGS
ncbi:hypothetical protein QYE76_007310 [Lolium multiflorum]|uniref:Pentatricopeptide repeat-containing protein n=1 Tax=Lolium multiflorum TaxID=4521 RepID=A0AAD8RXD3_LOLMU|nr:hypothetical protein QYE76_007310 [Lolium multiflorum]